MYYISVFSPVSDLCNIFLLLKPNCKCFCTCQHTASVVKIDLGKVTDLHMQGVYSTQCPEWKH